MPVSLNDIKKNNKDSSIDFVNNAYNDSKTYMQNLYRQWALNLAWFRGDQNVDFSTSRSQFVKNTKNPWQARIVANKILPLVRQQVARLADPRPTWIVDPATSDEEDIQIANTSTKVLQAEWIKLGLDLLLLRTLFWQETTGSAFMKVVWDPDAGDEFQAVTQNVEADLLRQMSEMMGVEAPPDLVTLNQGEMNVSVVPAFNLIIDPVSAVFDESPYAIESNLRTIDWITDRYGNKWKGKLTETSEAEIFLYPYTYNANGDRMPKHGVLVQELTVKKGKRFKDGQHLVVADGEVLHFGKLPFDHGKLPYAPFLSIYDPSSSWGTCAAEQIRPQQARYNRILSGIVDHINLTAKVQWLTHASAKCNQITNKPGQNIIWHGNIAPTQTQPKALPAYVERTLSRTEDDMQDTASLHRVSQGQNEPGVRSAKAVLALQETDNEVNGPSRAFFNNGMITLGRLTIQTIFQYATEERIAETVGDFGNQETTTFINSDLVGRSRGDYFKVRLKLGAVNTMSRMARTEQVGNLLELGVLHPQKDRDVILGLIGLSDSMSVFDKYAAERARQFKEIERIIAGEQVQPTMFENHEIHIASIEKFISSGRRNSLEPKQLQAIQMHLLDHFKMQGMEMKLKALALGVPPNGPDNGANPRPARPGANSGNSGSPGGRTGSRAGNRDKAA